MRSGSGAIFWSILCGLLSLLLGGCEPTAGTIKNASPTAIHVSITVSDRAPALRFDVDPGQSYRLDSTVAGSGLDSVESIKITRADGRVFHFSRSDLDRTIRSGQSTDLQFDGTGLSAVNATRQAIVHRWGGPVLE